MPRAFVQPALRFMQVEAASGAVMLVAAVVAIVWANSPWNAAYDAFWSTELTVRLGDVINLDLTLHDWVNDAAMALFFLVAGLEIKRQLTLGELRDPRAAALPVMAALGGMIVPALIYFAINAGEIGQRGIGIPVATDIAFAVGVVVLAGNRIPLGARIFILTLAVVDDVGGIVVIAIFYATDVSFGWLAFGALTIASAVLLRRAEVRSTSAYVVLGVLCWLSFHEAGIEAAIVGVIFGLLVPHEPFHDPSEFGPTARRLVDAIEGRSDPDSTHHLDVDDDRERNEVALEDLARFTVETTSPLERIEGRIGLWVSFLVVPVFAFANAGVRIDTSAIEARVMLGALVGLVVGKTIGVFGASWLAVRLGWGVLPPRTTWRHIFGLAVTAGIGFTVALYVTELSFDDPALTSSAKLGVLAASVIAGTLGLLLLRRCPVVDEVESDSPEPKSVLA